MTLATRRWRARSTRADRPVVRISRRGHHGDTKSSVITQYFVHGADYAALVEAATTFRGLLHRVARAVRGKGEKANEESVSAFRQATSAARRGRARHLTPRYKGPGG
jgi:DNA gyrase subunit B